jgi:NEDD8-activating enzyme E1 regulatory subunit
MKSRSADYVALQNVYKSKARADIAEVLSTVRSLEKSLGRTAPAEESEVEAFCKGAAHIKLVRGKPLKAFRPGKQYVWGDRAKFARNALTDETSLILLYFAFLAWDVFYATNQFAAGAEDVESDAVSLTGFARKIIDDLISEAGKSLDSEELDDVREKVGEVCQEM